MCTVKPENVDKVMAIFDLWDITAVPIAVTTDTGRTRLFWNKEKIFDMDIGFLTGGPVYNRPYEIPKPLTKRDEVFPKVPSVSEAVLDLLSDLNVASKEWAIRQYDHEVRAGTVIHPIVGDPNFGGPGDATVLRPVPDRMKGLAAAVGCNPWFAGADPYRGGKACLDEAFRNVVAVGARPNAFTDCLNFGNPEKPERLGEFREAIRGLGETAREMGIPIPSGNVSMYNEAPGGEHILPTPMIVCCGLIDDVSKAVSADFKKIGSMVYVIGDTKDEMGASLLFRRFGGKGGDVPDVDVARLKEVSGRLLEAMDKGLVRACHDCSDGGLAVAVAEMCISGRMGAEIDLSLMGDLPAEVKLFSESNSRWIAEVQGAEAEAFEAIMGDAATPIGITKGDALVIKGTDARIPVGELRAAWNDPVWKLMGGAA
jgi:phosphoribosylformylglycinamidine synthase